MESRWFSVPVKTDTTNGDVTEERPKYYDQVQQYSGKVFSHNNKRRYVVEFTGEADVLDTIKQKSDVKTRPENGLSKSEVASHLNGITGQERSYEEWTDRFTQ